MPIFEMIALTTSGGQGDPAMMPAEQQAKEIRN